MTTQAKSRSVFCFPQKGETVKRIREQVRMEFGRAAQGTWFGGEGISLPTFSLRPHYLGPVTALGK